MTETREQPELLLRDTLGDLITEHERLLDLTRQQREAIAAADLPAMRDCATRQSELTQVIRQLDQRRIVAIATFAEGRGSRPGTRGGRAGRPGQAMTVRRIADELPEPSRTSLLEIADRLRSIITALKSEQEVVQDAVGCLAGHMEGLVRQIADTLSHTGTYARGGAPAKHHQVVSALDVTS